MFVTLVRCSVAAVASIALLAAFVIAPEEFTQPRKPKRTGRVKNSAAGEDGLRGRHANRRTEKTRD